MPAQIEVKLETDMLGPSSKFVGIHFDTMAECSYLVRGCDQHDVNSEHFDGPSSATKDREIPWRRPWC